MYSSFVLMINHFCMLNHLETNGLSLRKSFSAKVKLSVSQDSVPVALSKKKKKIEKIDMQSLNLRQYPCIQSCPSNLKFHPKIHSSLCKTSSHLCKGRKNKTRNSKLSKQSEIRFLLQAVQSLSFLSTLPTYPHINIQFVNLEHI